MKAYRRRFVLFNMLMVGIVLTAMVAGVAVYMYRDYYDSLHDTMAQVVKPLSALSAEASDAEPADTAEADATQDPPTSDSVETTETGVGTDTPSPHAAALPPEEDTPQPPSVEQPPQAQGPQPSSSSAPIVPAGEDAPPAGAETPQLPEEAPAQVPGDAPQQPVPEQMPQPPEDDLPSPAGQPPQNEDNASNAGSRKDIAAVVYDPESDSTAVVSANNSILLEDPEAPVGSLKRWVDSTGQAARQMQALVDEMLTLAAAQRGCEAPPVPIDFSDVVEKAALQLESVAYDKQVTLETELAAHVTVPGSAESLQRIAASLVENAIKYEPAGGSVTVRLTAARRQARLAVRNGGSIIPPEALPHVFDRFYRGEKSRSPVEGHGLGLAIVRQLTENLGGSITVHSDETEGTVFLVTLPGKETPQN